MIPKGGGHSRAMDQPLTWPYWRDVLGVPQGRQTIERPKAAWAKSELGDVGRGNVGKEFLFPTQEIREYFFFK